MHWPPKVAPLLEPFYTGLGKAGIPDTEPHAVNGDTPKAAHTDF
jgi:hypothetical protein